MEDKAYKITQEWLNLHKTPAGGLTDAQIIALTGTTVVKKQKGWLRKLVGTNISLSQKERYEQGKYVYKTH